MNVKRQYRNLRMLGRKFKYDIQYRKQKTSLEQMLQDIKENKILFITNDNFGGTRQFEENFVKEHEHIIVLRRHSYGERPDLIYEIINCDTNKIYWAYLKDLDSIWNYSFSEIVVNTMVHYSEIKQILSRLSEYKQWNNNCKIIYMVHDFNSICIKCNLFVKDHFCKLACQKEKCSLYLADSNIQIDEWRMMWSAFWKKCDEVRCFSESSKLLIREAYPELEENKVKVSPHDTSFIKFSPIKGVEQLPFHLGIVGNCAADFKGKLVVEQVLRKYGDNAPITLIGSNYRTFRIRRKFVNYTGVYKHDDLQKILQEQQVSCVLFPSLCPETFSYLVSELIAMDLPVICFDYGAQAEKIREYDKGIVCESPAELLQILDGVVNKEIVE